MNAFSTRTGKIPIIVSMVAFYLSLAMISAAIWVSYLMLFVAGFYAWRKHYKIAVGLFVINALAVYFHIALVSQT